MTSSSPVSKRVMILFSTIAVVGIVGYFVSLIARGYQFNLQSFKFNPNGIIVIKSDPDGASIYINGDLKGATNSNLKLSPGSYDLEVKKDGFISWSKRLSIKKEEVTQVSAHLFKIAPSLSPITLEGASRPVPSHDFGKLAYLSKNELMIMSVSLLPIGFNNDPKRISDNIPPGAGYQFSPDDKEILVRTDNEAYLLPVNEFTSQSNRINIISKLDKVIKDWAVVEKEKNLALFKYLPTEMVNILSDKAKKFYFSPDSTMVLYEASADCTLKKDLISPLPGSSSQKEDRDIKVGKTYVYDIKEDKNFLVNDTGRSLYWLPTSKQLILPDENKVIIMDYDGTNKQVVFSGNYIAPHAYPYVNASKLLILTNFGSDSQTPNLYSLSIK